MSNTQIIASVPLPVESLRVGDVETTNVAQFLTMLQAATPEQAADILSVLDRGLPLWSSRKEALEAAVAEVTPVKAKKAPAKAPSAPQKPKKEKPVKVVAALPEAAEGAPDAADYRVDASSIDETLCIGRNLKGGEDKRWKPIIYRESQCGGKRVEGSDLCTKCSKREEKCAENPAKPGDWNGRITEEPEAWVHMLGTTWAEEKGCKFVGGSADTHAAAAGSVASVEDAAEAASENGSAEEMPAVAAAAPAAVKAAVADKKAEKATAAAAKAAEKAATAAAAKAAKEAEKEAAKAAKAAEKEAEKAAKLAAKEAEKLAKAAAKPAAAPKAAAKPKAAAAKPKPEAKKAAVAEPVAVEGELKLIDGTLYMVKNGNVFEYDELAEKAGDFVGRLTGDETIDTEADEVTAAESDSE